MKRYKILIILILAGNQVFAQNEAAEIFRKATDKFLTTNVEITINQKSSDKKGRVKEKSFDLRLGKFGEETKTKMVMQKPERAKGITISISKKAGEEGVIEVFTPANGKIRKMIANDKNMALVGSDFNISAYNSLSLNKLNIVMLEDGEYESKSIYKLAVTKIENSDNQRAELWIEKETNYLVQILIQDMNGKVLSVSKLSDYRPVTGTNQKVQPMLIQSEDCRKNTSSEIEVVSIKPVLDFKPEDFHITGVNE